MQPSLLVLAAGMGSRYGGIKQIVPVGPAGETILEYSVYDALHAGFGTIVFLVRKSIHEDFRTAVLSRLPEGLRYAVAFQELDSLLTAGQVAAMAASGRTKPWGTAHAILCARQFIEGPFAVINSDDFYGRTSFAVVARFLQAVEPASASFCMAGYRLRNTTSPNGTVGRGVCTVSPEGYLRSVVEHTKIAERDGAFVSITDAGEQAIDGDSTVSMNLFGFTQAVFDTAARMFRDFITTGVAAPKAELYLPSVVNEAIVSGTATVKVLATTERWFGVTYREDHDTVVAEMARLTEEGVYPSPLWGRR